MARIIQFEGRQIEVPDDATPDEIDAIFSATPSAPPVTDSYAPPAMTPQPNVMDVYAPPGMAETKFTEPAERQLTRAETLSYGSQAALRGVGDLFGSVYDMPNAAFMGGQWLGNEADSLLTGAPDTPSVGRGGARRTVWR
jgi:hypothetical protein